MTIFGLTNASGTIGWGSQLPFGISVNAARRVLVKRTLSDNVIGWYGTAPHPVGLFLAKNDATGQVGWMDPAAVTWNLA